MARYSRGNGSIDMTDLHFKHVQYEITLTEGKKGELALNKQVDLTRIVLLEAGFHLLYTQVQRLALGFALVQSPHKGL